MLEIRLFKPHEVYFVSKSIIQLRMRMLSRMGMCLLKYAMDIILRNGCKTQVICWLKIIKHKIAVKAVANVVMNNIIEWFVSYMYSKIDVLIYYSRYIDVLDLSENLHSTHALHPCNDNSNIIEMKNVVLTWMI